MNLTYLLSFKDYLKLDRKIGWSFREIFFKVQNKYRWGPLITRINKKLVQTINTIKPELVFIYRGVIIYPETLSSIRKNSILFTYNNDDPFGKSYTAFFWRHFLNGLANCDHIFYFREKNYEDYRRLGYENTSLLRGYYIKEKHFPIKIVAPNKYSSDVIFIGHYERDNRAAILKYLIDNNINLKIFGPEWKYSNYYRFFSKKIDIIPVRNDYNLAINSAKIALSFLSKINNDTYTTRSFEIPATQTFMLSEYSRDLDNLFKEGKEAEYFRSKQELLEKINYYLIHDKERERIASAGYQRLLKEGHEVSDRVNLILKIFNNYKR